MIITDTYKLFISTLVDKYGDASVEDFEFNELLQRATLAVLSDQFNNRNKRKEDGVLPYAFEISQTDMHKWHTIIQEVDIETDDAGKVDWTAVEALLIGSKKIFHINTPLAFVESKEDYKKCRYLRHNDYAEFIDNDFIKPTTEEPMYRGFGTYIQIDPKVKTKLKLTVTRYPVIAKLDDTTPSNNIDSELTDVALNDVLIRMEQYFGAKIREPQLYQTASDQENKQ